MMPHRSHELVRLGRQQRARFDGVVAAAAPRLPQSRECKRPIVGELEVVVLLKELASGQKAAAPLERLTEAGLRIDVFTRRVEALTWERPALRRLVGRLPPERQQAPFGRDHFALVAGVESDNRHLRQWVVSRVKVAQLIEI